MAAPSGQSSLLIVDAQKQYRTGPLALSGVEAALGEGERLLDAARSGSPSFMYSIASNRVVPSIPPPKPCRLRIPWRRAPDGQDLPNAFAGTDLTDRLGDSGARTLIVAGFMTHICVSSTVRAALDRGYACTVVSAACATRDLPDGAGGIVPAAELQCIELATLADRFARIAADTSQLLE